MIVIMYTMIAFAKHGTFRGIHIIMYGHFVACVWHIFGCRCINGLIKYGLHCVYENCGMPTVCRCTFLVLRCLLA